MTRVKVFIDYQNVYMGARESFGDSRNDPYTFGQIYPRRLALLVKEKGKAVDSARDLEEVRVYRGEPAAKHNRVGQAAFQRQVQLWAAQQRVAPRTRPLHYRPTAWDGCGRPSAWEAREKGIDVLLAIDMVTGAVRDDYDVAVVVSADTDLVPAIEAALDLGKRVEVASWHPDKGWGSRLTIPGRNPWCHWLDRTDFNRVSDDTDYTRPVTGQP